MVFYFNYHQLQAMLSYQIYSTTNFQHLVKHCKELCIQPSWYRTYTLNSTT